MELNPASFRMRRTCRVACATAALAAWSVVTGLSPARAQSIEPRAYSNAPIGVNFLLAGYVYTRGGLSFDSSVPVTNPHLDVSNAVIAYVKVLDFWGKSGKVDVIVPYSWLSGTADYQGQPLQRMVNGFGDPYFRLSVNLYGAPALTRQEFVHYQQDLIIGASLQVTAPWSQYDDRRVVNLGTNRWSFKPEVGISKAVGQWTFESQLAATFFTDNTDFYNGHTRSQDPIYSIQGHVIYGFKSGIWASADATYFGGGRTTIDGTLKPNLQRNWRFGATLAIPVDVRNSVKLNASKGTSARTNNNYDLIGIAWQYRWGAGLP